MSDSAKGPVAGYIYQFEIALLELSKLKPDEKISLEKIDDISKEDKTTYLFTIQAKHSIASGTTNFGSTSTDLWKTLNIWVSKIKKGLLSHGNKFIAITNVNIPSNSIIRKFNQKNFDDNIEIIEQLLNDQEKKLQKKLETGKDGVNIAKTIERIKKVLENKDELKIIFENFNFQENYEVTKEFFNEIHLGSIDSQNIENYRKEIYDSFLGWIISTSKENWLGDREALFSKKDFEQKLLLIQSHHPIENAIFRNKKQLKNETEIDFELNRDDLYIKQIQDIDRNEEDKEDILKEAIYDFILCDIEIRYLISRGSSMLTRVDFEEFQNTCEVYWKKTKRKYVKKEIEHYNETQLNEFAMQIYDEIMNELKLNFQDTIGFNDSNKYIQNGTFLNLSNVPKIGWHPDWKKKYL